VFDFYATIGVFATWYQRVCELCVGESFLDAGCESGFLPLVIAERIPFMERVVGVDIRPDMFAVVRELARERQLHKVQFAQADLLADDFSSLGQFDTVTAIGVIEHFIEADMHRVLTNLLQVTAQRLILIVPYEEELEVIYEHEQLFTRAKLEAVGQWCLQQLGGASRMWCEDCEGGLLLIERRPSRVARDRHIVHVKQ
jgi:SAM-dependent methyltransferase